MTSIWQTPWLRRALIALPLLLAAAALIWWLGRPMPIAVVLAHVGRGTVEATIANTRAGSVEACQRTKLSTIVGGRIEVLAVKEGDRVKKGQLLMRLWNDDMRAQENLAQASVETARKRVVEACTIAESAEREVARQSELNARGFVSTNSIDNARAAADAKAAGCATARADVAQTEASVRLAHVQQARTVLTAPFDGTVADLAARTGQQVVVDELLATVTAVPVTDVTVTR